MFHETLWRRRSARSPLSVAATSSKLTSLTRAISGIAAGTTPIAARATPVSSRAFPAWAPIAFRPFSWPGTITTRSEVSLAAARPGGPQFLFGQFSVAVLIEFLEGGGRVGDFFGGKYAVVIRVERLHERIGPPAVRPARRSLRRASLVVAAGRPLAVAIVVPMGRTFGRLGDDDCRTNRTEDTH